MKLYELIEFINFRFPLVFQESYDNSGLIYGDPSININKILVTLDVTEKVISEALDNGCNLIISHHPPVFKEFRKITKSSYSERILISAIKNEIALLAIHTNLDNIADGLNFCLCRKLGINFPKILQPRKGFLRKLVTFCPSDHSERVREALFAAGAGHIGNYEKCSFMSEGTGTFLGSEISNPFVGEKGQLHFEHETKIETIYPLQSEKNILKALFSSHPYEEVAYDIFNLENVYPLAGSGAIGELDDEMDETEFLERIKSNLPSTCLLHSDLLHKPVKKIAVCGGSGSFLIREAISQKADVFITGEIKYHDFFDAEKSILLVAAGHYETEHFAKEIIADAIQENFPNFAVLKSNVYTNAINYK